jgi:hypothetical protein
VPTCAPFFGEAPRALAAQAGETNETKKRKGWQERNRGVGRYGMI